MLFATKLSLAKPSFSQFSAGNVPGNVFGVAECSRRVQNVAAATPGDDLPGGRKRGATATTGAELPRVTF